MPPRRSRGGASTSSRPGQSTLSFNNRASRVTKPSVSQPTLDKKKNSTSKLNQVAQAEIIDTLAEAKPVVTEVKNDEEQPEATEQAQINIETEITPTKPRSKKKSRTSTSSLTSDDLEIALSSAQSLPETRIKKYWKAEEATRLAPRVHQSSLPLQEKILRHFDLSHQYGPCIGIARLSRWKRAYTLNLNPPLEVLAVLLHEEERGEKRETGTIAYVDELGGGEAGIFE